VIEKYKSCTGKSSGTDQIPAELSHFFIARNEKIKSRQLGEYLITFDLLSSSLPLKKYKLIYTEL
jgi:hypothetical protein